MISDLREKDESTISSFSEGSFDINSSFIISLLKSYPMTVRFESSIHSNKSSICIIANISKLLDMIHYESFQFFSGYASYELLYVSFRIFDKLSVPV